MEKEFMQEAIREALVGLSAGGYPIGSVLVEDGQIVGRGHNRWVQHGDATAHGEIDCLRNSGRLRYHENTVLYSTHMPCSMCSGAIIWFGIRKVVSGENRTYKCSTEFLQLGGVEVVDLDLEECYQLIRTFKERFPKQWEQDMADIQS